MRPLFFLLCLLPGISPYAQKATATLVDHLQTAYGPAWEQQVPSEFDYIRTTTSPAGEIFHRYQVLHDQIPVFGRTLTARLSSAGTVLSLSGDLSPLTELAPAAAPSLSPSALAQLARHALTPGYPHAAQWTITDRGTYWTSSNPWQPGRLHHTRALEVSEPAGHRAEMVYVETTTGRVILRYPLHCSLDRRLYQSRISGANRIWVEGNAFPGNLDAEEQEMLQTSKEVYHFFQRTFDRNSFDGQNGQMRQVVDVIFRGDSLNGGCPNARASNGAIYHCNGVVSDDVVAHEWTHNYMAAINGIIYQFESGAISEGYADIFGEVVDLLNTRGGDTGDHLPRTSCDDPGLRWRLGEDIVAIDTFIRDLWLPECRDDPSSRSSANYACFDLDQDDGGVHVNSGLVNRTFTLLVDGGVLRGDTVVGIGLTKAVHLFFHAADKYFSPVTDFNALGMMLRQSAHDLAGTPLSELTLLDLPTSFSQDTITSFDSLQLERAMRATGLEEPSPCPTVDNLAQMPPSPCAAASDLVFVPFFSENWENGLPADWTVTETPDFPTTWTAKPWAIATMLPDSRAGRAMYAPSDQPSTSRSRDSGTTELTSPTIVLPVTETAHILQFDHYFSTQEGYDGGILQYTLNDGDFDTIPLAAFIYNGYNAPLRSSLENDNPLASYPAFNGTDSNSTTGTWGTSMVDLTALGVVGGDSLRLRWILGHDGYEGWLGWYLDEVRIGFCGEQALPVTYRFFTAAAAKDHVRLNWQTETEDRNAGFYVERRQADGGAYVDLGFVAAGTEYVFRDYRAIPGREYVYRLRQTDLDGSIDYSTLVRAGLEASLRVFPNPAGEFARVVTPPEVTWVGLFDLQGRQLGRRSAGAGEVFFDLAGLSAGVYLIRAGTEVRRLLVR